MTALQQKQAAFLINTLDYYLVDPEKRRCQEKGRCRYYPGNANKLGLSDGCAIGRHLPVELQKELDTRTNECVDNDTVFNSLPTVLQELTQSFLLSIQSLHDDSIYWEDKCLSISGTVELKSIIKSFNLDVSLFSKYLSQ